MNAMMASATRADAEPVAQPLAARIPQTLDARQAHPSSENPWS